MKYLFFLFLILPVFIFGQNARQSSIDSIQQLISKAKKDTNKAILLDKLALFYFDENPDKALQYEEQSLNLAKELKWEQGMADAYCDIGNCYTTKFNIEKAIANYLKGIEIFKRLNDKKRIAKTYTNMGIIYQNENQLSLSLEYYFKALGLAEELKDSNMIAFGHANIGSLYQITGDFKKAIYYDSISLHYFTRLKNEEEIAGNWVGIGNAHKSLGNLNKALEAMLKALKIYNETNNAFGKALSLTNIGTVYEAKGDYEQAIQYELDALKEFKSLDDENGLSVTEILLGDYYYKIAMSPGKHSKNSSIPATRSECLNLSIQYLKHAIPILTKRNNLSDLSAAYKSLASAQQASKDYQAAIESYLKYTFYKDSVYSIEVAQKINNHENQREIDLRESKIKLLAQDIKLKDVNAQKQRLMRNALLGGILSLLTIAAFIIAYYVRKQRNDKLLADEKVNTLLKDQELRSVSDMLEVQEQERKRIAADLHDRLGSMLSTVKLYFNSVEEQIDHLKTQNREQYHKATTLLDEACDEVRKISHNLVSGELIKFGLVSALNQLKVTLNETGKLTMHVLAFGMETRLDSAVEISLYRVIQELMNNMLKHAKANEVTIQLNKVDNNLNIVVEDNGIGFDVADALEKNGMGLRSVETRVKKLNGTLSIDSSKGRGTTTIIDIPIG
ncbi:MAG: sensor histidine kinase [Bacteroidetes bacterium]|nr:sensor histidine kinase [Bacteroidota bacterium]